MTLNILQSDCCILFTYAIFNDENLVLHKSKNVHKYNATNSEVC